MPCISPSFTSIWPDKEVMIAPANGLAFIKINAGIFLEFDSYENIPHCKDTSGLHANSDMKVLSFCLQDNSSSINVVLTNQGFYSEVLFCLLA